VAWTNLFVRAKKRQCEVRKEFFGASMIRVMRIYEIALSPRKKRNMYIYAGLFHKAKMLLIYQ
jgi:hypothetical protein